MFAEDGAFELPYLATFGLPRMVKILRWSSSDAKNANLTVIWIFTDSVFRGFDYFSHTRTVGEHRFPARFSATPPKSITSLTNNLRNTDSH
jgi:hypothetical protein